MMEVTVSLVRTEALRGMDLGMVETAMPQRAARARRFRFENDRLLCLGAGFLMMRALGIRAESEVCLGENGKPYAPGFPPFSISHSGSVCILASVPSGAVGADIEAVDPKHLDIASSVYTPAELGWMAQDPMERFFRLWTWKESVMKATGLGLALEPRRLEVLPFAGGGAVHACGRDWYARGGSLDGYVFSVCADAPLAPPRWTEYRPE